MASRENARFPAVSFLCVSVSPCESRRGAAFSLFLPHTKARSHQELRRNEDIVFGPFVVLGVPPEADLRLGALVVSFGRLCALCVPPQADSTVRGFESTT